MNCLFLSHMNYEYIAFAGDFACGITNCDHTTDKFNIDDNCCTNKENFACFGANDCCKLNLLAYGFKVSCITNGDQVSLLTIVGWTTVIWPIQDLT